MRNVRVFISSPSDVLHERQRAQRVIERLNGEYATVLKFEAILWEKRFYGAHAGFQEAIPDARECDIVIGVLWSRLGMPLADTFERMPPEFAEVPDEPYPSGTGFELLSSIFASRAAAKEGKAKPDVFVFRKDAPAVMNLGDSNRIAEAQRQWQRLQSFFERWFLSRDGVYRAAFHTFTSTDDFERALDALLRTWIKDNHADAAAVVWSADKGSPFRGLAAFDARYAPVFFGRDRKVSRAIELLKDAGEAATGSSSGGKDPRERRSRPFLLIVGPSGSGKSSLMMAGLAPRLTAPGVVTGVDLWRVAVMRPGDAANPLDAVVQALIEPAQAARADEAPAGGALPEPAVAIAEPAGFRQHLESRPQVAADMVVAALDAAGERERLRMGQGFDRPLAANLLLLVDQLEDIFSATNSDAQRDQLARVLAALAGTRRVWVVATLRGDLYERLISDRPWIALKDAGATYDLAPPGPEELEEIVRRSAAAAGLHYETDPESGERLDDRLLKDATGQDILPLLQFTLNRLYEAREVSGGETQLTFKAYRDLGGLGGAIDQAAERAMSTLGHQEIAALPRLLRMLAVPIDDRVVAGGSAGALTMRAVKSRDARRDAPSSRLVDALVQARILLVSRDEDAEGALVRVAHQRVFESWRRASAIIGDHQDFYRIRDDVEKQHQRWVVGGRPRQLLIPRGVAISEAEKVARNYREDLPEHIVAFVGASSRRARWRQRALQSATVVFAIVAAIAGWQSYVATEAKQSAEANYATARGTIDGLIRTFAGRLSQMEGITVSTVEAAFNEISKSVDELGQRAAATDPTFNKTRADLAYEFARTYDKAQSPRALEVAREGLLQITELSRKFPDNVEYKLALSRSHEQLGDLQRTRAPKASIEAIKSALAIRRELSTADPENPRLAEELIKIVTRMGDFHREIERDFKAADARYREAYELSLIWFLRQPDEAVWQLQLSWGLNKEGDQRLRGPRPKPAEAASYFEQSLCLRRRLYEGDTGNAKYQADLSWTLDRVGRARQLVGQMDGAAAAFVEAIGLRRTLARDRDNKIWLRDLYIILTRYGEHHLKTGGASMLASAYLQEAERMHPALIAHGPLGPDVPDYRPLLAKAKGQLEVARTAVTQAEFDLVISLEESARQPRYLINRPRSADCWADMIKGIEALGATQDIPTSALR